MKNTTIAIKKELKEEIEEFATKKETYSEVIERLLQSAKERQLHDILMSSEDTVSIEEAKKRLKRKWPK